MNDKERLSDERESKNSSSISFYFKITIAILIAIYLAIHTGETLFGENGIQILEDVQQTKKNLKIQVQNIKLENATLQKKYFETISLKPQIEELNITENFSENNTTD